MYLSLDFENHVSLRNGNKFKKLLQRQLLYQKHKK